MSHASKCAPQTWYSLTQNLRVLDGRLQGDNDPVDVVEIGSIALEMGGIYPVRICVLCKFLRFLRHIAPLAAPKPLNSDGAHTMYTLQLELRASESSAALDRGIALE